MSRILFFLSTLIIAIVGCRQEAPNQFTPVGVTATTPVTRSPVPVNDVESTEESPTFITVATDAPSRFQDFEDIDPFGNVVGFDPGLMAELGLELGIDYEFVVTSYNGLLNSVSQGEFDVAMSALLIPTQPIEGLTFSDPYLEVGQVLVVRANDTVLQSYRDIDLGVTIGAQQFSSGEQTAREMIGLHEPELVLFDTPGQAIQAVIDGQVDGAVIDSDDAEYFAGTYPLQLKISGGEGKDAWITEKAYGIAVAQGRQILLTALNDAIAQAKNNGTIDRLTQEWLISAESIDAGESLVGTPPDELIIGIAGELESLDSAARNPDLIRWEVQQNISSGLYMVNADNELVPVLAEDFPLISEDKLEYTVRMRPGLKFPDGSELTAEDVKFSVDRAAALGNFQVNRYLKDSNEDNFADGDAVQIIDPLTIKFTLQKPTAFFPSVLATPPFFVVNETCYLANPDPVVSCSNLGAYSVAEWVPGEKLSLQANEQWLGDPVNFDKIQIRFYEDSARMRRSLENEAIDVAWTGTATSDLFDLRENDAYRFWEGPSAFKSYLVFEQNEAPWSSARLREAISFAIDREALANDVFDDLRTPLYSPVPDGTPGQLRTEPERDLESARSILIASGYSPSNKLEMTIWYVNDGRYGDTEDLYAERLKDQIEETDLVEVTLEGASWEVFRPQSLDCGYPAFLLGWPSSGQPTQFLDAMSWMEYFITNTDSVCSNYESRAMETLYEQAMEENDTASRLGLYQQIQELWAREFPTLDLTQEPRFAISAMNVDGVVVDAMGLLHYEQLSKVGG